MPRSPAHLSPLKLQSVGDTLDKAPGRCTSSDHQGSPDSQPTPTLQPANQSVRALIDELRGYSTDIQTWLDVVLPIARYITSSESEEISIDKIAWSRWTQAAAERAVGDVVAGEEEEAPDDGGVRATTVLSSLGTKWYHQHSLIDCVLLRKALTGFAKTNNCEMLIWSKSNGG